MRSIQGWLVGCMLAGLAATLTGCESGQRVNSEDPARAFLNAPEAEPQADPNLDPEVARVRRLVEQYDRQMRQGADDAADATDAAATASPVAPTRPPAPQVVWENQPEPPAAAAPPDRSASQAAQPDPAAEDAAGDTGASAPENKTVQATATTAAALDDPAPQAAILAPDLSNTRRDLIDTLLARIDASDDSALSKAAAAAALSVIDAGASFDERFLDPLKPPQREQVERLRRVMLALSRHVATGEPLDPDTLAKQVDELTGAQTVRIRKVVLCDRVSGYGIYEPFLKNKFLAGRKHPMIVYAELDNFSVAQSKSNMHFHEVRLSQELTLFTYETGYAAWSEKAVTIVDESRNRRRDFFTVQVIELPAELSVGKYVLNVRITDLLGQTVDEEKVQIEVTAEDRAVVRGDWSTILDRTGRPVQSRP